MKHQSGWGMRQLAGGVIEWTSPTGRTYEHEPESRVYFRDTSAPRARSHSADIWAGGDNGTDGIPPWAPDNSAEAPPDDG